MNFFKTNKKEVRALLATAREISDETGEQLDDVFKAIALNTLQQAATAQMAGSAIQGIAKLPAPLLGEICPCPVCTAKREQRKAAPKTKFPFQKKTKGEA